MEQEQTPVPAVEERIEPGSSGEDLENTDTSEPTAETTDDCLPKIAKKFSLEDFKL